MDARLTSSKSRHSQLGVTLVELMVASAILGVSIAATISIIGTGINLEYTRNIERQAYLIARGALENPAYTYPSNYDNIPSFSDTNWINTSSRPVNVAINVQAFTETKEDWPPYNSTFWKRVDATVRWTISGKADSVKVTKLLAQIE